MPNISFQGNRRSSMGHSARECHELVYKALRKKGNPMYYRAWEHINLNLVHTEKSVLVACQNDPKLINGYIENDQLDVAYMHPFSDVHGEIYINDACFYNLDTGRKFNINDEHVQTAAVLAKHELLHEILQHSQRARQFFTGGDEPIMTPAEYNYMTKAFHGDVINTSGDLDLSQFYTTKESRLIYQIMIFEPYIPRTYLTGLDLEFETDEALLSMKDEKGYIGYDKILDYERKRFSDKLGGKSVKQSLPPISNDPKPKPKSGPKDPNAPKPEYISRDYVYGHWDEARQIFVADDGTEYSDA